MAGLDRTLTAKNFHEPLLQTLFALAEGKAKRPVDHKEAYPPVCQKLGITLDQYGKQESTGSPWVEKWTQWAFREMVEKGFCVGVGRGQWALTDAGIAAASGAAVVPIVETSPAPVAETPAAEAPPQIPPGISLNVGPGQAEDAYHPDPYIRALAIPDTKCFDSYSSQSTVCGRCPLQGPCINAMASQLSIHARQLAQEDEQEETRKALAAKAKANPAPTASVSVPAPTPAVPSPPKGKATGAAPNKIIAQQQSLCTHCGQPIARGEEVYWVRTDGINNQTGLFHLNCYEVKK